MTKTHTKTTAKTELIMERMALSQIQSDPRNVNMHDDRSITVIGESLQRFGQQKPIVVDGIGVVIAGNGTLEAARRLGWTEIDVCRTQLTGPEARAFAIADNRTAQLANWNEVMLAQQLDELGADPAGELGFDADELAELMAKLPPLENDRDEPGLSDGEMADMRLSEEALDEVGVETENIVTSLGDVWLLGNHRLMCGDSTVVADVEKLIADHVPVCVAADPPYGMGKVADGVQNDNLKGEKLDAFQLAWWRACVGLLEEHASAYVWGNAPDLWRLWFEGGLRDEEPLFLRNEIVWTKGSMSLGKKIPGNGMRTSGSRQYATFSDRCLFFVRGLKTDGYFDNTHDAMHDVWEYSRVRGEERFGHSTPKPVEMIGRILMSSSRPRDVIYDPFSGTGTVIAAAQSLDRVCCAMELTPAYVDVAIRRWEAMTGLEAKLEESGESFADRYQAILEG